MTRHTFPPVVYDWGDVDEVSVLRMCQGMPPEGLITPAERMLAVLALIRRGLSHEEIAPMVACSSRQIERLRKLSLTMQIPEMA